MADRLVLTPLTESDLPILHGIVTANRDFLEELEWIAYSPQPVFEFHYGAILRGGTLSCFVIREGSTILGMVEVDDRGDHFYIGYWVVPQFWNRGVASRVVARVVEKLCPVKPVKADTRLENGASARVLARCGFQHTHDDLTHSFWVLPKTS